MNYWKVQAIVNLPDKKCVEVELGMPGKDSVRFQTRQFAVGKRSNKVAALARFASRAGYGEVDLVFRYLRTFSPEQVGEIFPAGPLGYVPEEWRDECGV